MKTNIRGGIEIGDSIQVYEHGEHLLLRLRARQIYMPVPQHSCDISDQLQFLVLGYQSLLPASFEDDRGIKHIRFDLVLEAGAGCTGCKGMDDLDHALRLLHDALVFTGGVHSLGQKEEWAFMVENLLQRRGIDLPDLGDGQ